MKKEQTKWKNKGGKGDLRKKNREIGERCELWTERGKKRKIIKMGDGCGGGGWGKREKKMGVGGGVYVCGGLVGGEGGGEEKGKLYWNPLLLRKLVLLHPSLGKWHSISKFAK